MKMLTLALSCLALSFASVRADQTDCIQKLVCEEACSGQLTLTFYYNNASLKKASPNPRQAALPKVTCQNAFDLYSPGPPKCIKPPYKLIVVPPPGHCNVTTKSVPKKKAPSTKGDQRPHH